MGGWVQPQLGLFWGFFGHVFKNKMDRGWVVEVYPVRAFLEFFILDPQDVPHGRF